MKFTTRFSVTLLLLLLASCISYEPVILRPAITLRMGKRSKSKK